MQRFEYLVCASFHVEAENVARSFGSREKERLNAYSEVLVKELNRLGALGWELMQAPDQSSNRNWIFKRQLA